MPDLVSLLSAWLIHCVFWFSVGSTGWAMLEWFELWRPAAKKEIPAHQKIWLDQKEN